MTDEAVMAMVKKGDLEKAAILFERYQAMLYNFFVKLSYETELSKDLTQNVFYRLIKYRNSFNEQKPFKAWFFQLARNQYLDHVKNSKNKRSRTGARFDDLEKLAHKAAENMQDEAQKEREKVLYKALSLLDEEQREMIVLSKFQKMKYTEIAQILGITESAVKVKVHRAIKKLKGVYFMTEQN